MQLSVARKVMGNIKYGRLANGAKLQLWTNNLLTRTYQAKIIPVGSSKGRLIGTVHVWQIITPIKVVN